MTKALLTVITGVFVGAFAKEALARDRASVVSSHGHGKRSFVNDFKAGFAEAYRNEEPGSAARA